jgi:hypothetical protein
VDTQKVFRLLIKVIRSLTQSPVQSSPIKTSRFGSGFGSLWINPRSAIYNKTHQKPTQYISILSFPSLSDSLRADQEKKNEDYVYDVLHHRGWRYAKQKEGSRNDRKKVKSRLGYV